MEKINSHILNKNKSDIEKCAMIKNSELENLEGVVKMLIENQRVSATLIQLNFSFSYPKAVRYIEELYNLAVIEKEENGYTLLLTEWID